MNEARGYQRHSLSKEQREEALAAIYGLNQPKPMNQQYSPDQLEMMRQILAQYEEKKPAGLKEFDLNNPPKQPYFYQEFPRMVYHHAKRTTQITHSAQDLAAALEAGWSTEPFPAEHVEVELDAADLAEIKQADATARRNPKKAA